jgi:hypothetical protein
MSDILSQKACLKLNKKGEPVRVEAVQKTIVDLSGWWATPRGALILDKNGLAQRHMLAWDINFEQDEDGNYLYDANHVDWTATRLVDWDTWITLPIRPFDLYIDSAKSQIRVPRAVQCIFTVKMPKKKWKNTLASVYELYGGVDAYTNEQISIHEASRDHVIPKSRGGKDDLSNIVLSKKGINHKKGNKLNKEAGLPDVQPKIPEEIPMCRYIKNRDGIPEWEIFLRKYSK